MTREGRCVCTAPQLIAVPFAQPRPNVPATGSQSLAPQPNWESAMPSVLVYRKYHVVFDGRNTAGVSVPSTIHQSPAIRRSPGSP